MLYILKWIRLTTDNQKTVTSMNWLKIFQVFFIIWFVNFFLLYFWWFKIIFAIEILIIPSNGVIRNTFLIWIPWCFRTKKNYVNYWEYILECLKNVSLGIPIKILELSIISENHCLELPHKWKFFMFFSNISTKKFENNSFIFHLSVIGITIKWSVYTAGL